ncbi:hypothetical protein, partial [Vibrio parahaemolyticus]|uniref:hypothetical protein n=1 Tax=Vibrio parahaemolyticus TaxID=670 RepID=UPI000A391104
GTLFNDLAKKEQLTRIGQSVKSQEKVTLKLEISCKTYPAYNAALSGEQRQPPSLNHCTLNTKFKLN